MKNKIKLFCLPYAGGSAKNIYGKWSNYLNADIEIIPVELAGRGTRIAESLYINVDDAVDDVLAQIKDEIGYGNYAFFGHSMGAILMYKVLQRIDELKLKQPVHAFFSGRRAPHCPGRKEKPYAKMTTLEIEKEIKRMGGTSPEFFKYPELKKIYMPIVKNDLKIADTLLESSEITRLDYNISLFLGKDEDVISHEAYEWRNCTNDNFSMHYFEGGHFFLNEETELVAQTINDTLVEQNLEIKI